MNALYVTSLVAVAIVVIALAVTLVTVAYVLGRTRRALADAAEAIATVADRAAPLGPAVTSVNQDLSAVRDALHGALPEPPAESSDGTHPRNAATAT